MNKMREEESGLLSPLRSQPVPGTIWSSVLQPLFPFRASQNLCSVPDLFSCNVRVQTSVLPSSD